MDPAEILPNNPSQGNMDEDEIENILKLLKRHRHRKKPLPEDYLNRVYAGVLGKVIGVYLGRPFEGWTHERIMQELGDIRYYVNERFGMPLVVTDDDISGTFTFFRALQEHRPSRLKAEDVGRTWLNNVIRDRTVFWWGGNGVSTEQTAFLNLQRGVRAPMSGSKGLNGVTASLQIGARIFVDGFAMACPGQPALAAKLATEAASVSHDGDALAAARMWAAMEAEAFVSKDVEHLLDVGMEYMQSDGMLGIGVHEVREWCKEDKDWLVTRQRIAANFGYGIMNGFCHIVPNHLVTVMALIYAGTDFGEAMHIVNTCGWDTDCNSGNLGCLVAIMNGLSAFDDSNTTRSGKVRGAGGIFDWRGPLADRVLISSADGGYSINNAANIAYDIANMGRRIAHHKPLDRPKNGAQFHFELPGSIQGFRAMTSTVEGENCHREVSIKQGYDHASEKNGLEIFIKGLEEDLEVIEVLSDVFAPPEVRQMEIYDLVCTPLLYPGQSIQLVVKADIWNSDPIRVNMVLKLYSFKDEIESHINGGSISLKPGDSKELMRTVPTIFDCKPIQAVGISLYKGRSKQNNEPFTGIVRLEYLRWKGIPKLTLRPVDIQEGPRKFYMQSFVNGADTFDVVSGKFVVAQNSGEGLVSYGTRKWDNYRVTFRDFLIPGHCLTRTRNGVAFRINGLRRYYALLFVQMSETKRGVVLTKNVDEQSFVLQGDVFDWQTDWLYNLVVDVHGEKLHVEIEGLIEFDACDNRFLHGGIGLIATEGAVVCGDIEVGVPKRDLATGDDGIVRKEYDMVVRTKDSV
ncbi:ADP-ribosylglycohydrolase [Annulohypoxylon stygium]|nr:ADP-ribosylglycohydrolase [Annulohypoxylon stygium]